MLPSRNNNIFYSSLKVILFVIMNIKQWVSQLLLKNLNPNIFYIEFLLIL